MADRDIHAQEGILSPTPLRVKEAALKVEELPNEVMEETKTAAEPEVPPITTTTEPEEASDAKTEHVGVENTIADEKTPPEDDDDSLSLTESEFLKTKHLSISADGLQTRADLTDYGLDIDINEQTTALADLLQPAFDQHADHRIQEIPAYLSHEACPRLNVVIQIVGSRGDVQPFVSLGKVLREKYGHRVRIATHLVFKGFVQENNLEFFNIGGDPAELMAFMVHNPGLIPDVATLRSGEVGKRRKGTMEMLVGCWRSCIEAGDGTGPPIFECKRTEDDGKPFVADAIIANPPSFAHIHCAEKLGVPLHLMFTMPWSPTRSFPHPLVNIKSSNATADQTNFISYALVEMMTWQGLGDVINKFRRTILNLKEVSLMWAPGMNSRLRIPFTYCWSPALIPKPTDWGSHISISGFYFLSLASSFTPDPSLLAFLEAGPPPVYIGFGSIVVDDPDAMTEMIFSAVKKVGARALVSKGWGGLGGDKLVIPEGVYMLGNIPHDWLFKHVSAVVHHGGAGTTAAGIAAGRPTVVVPFFGDQPFWGKMIARAGAGPEPIPFKRLNAENLASQIAFALKPETLIKAKELGEKMAKETGAEEGAALFHGHIGEEIRCSVLPNRPAVWRVKKSDVRLSALVATVLINKGLVDLKDLKLYRQREYLLEDGPWDPVSGVASTLIGTFGSLAMGVADLPTEFYKSLKGQIKPSPDVASQESNYRNRRPPKAREVEGLLTAFRERQKTNATSTGSLHVTESELEIAHQHAGNKTPTNESTVTLPVSHHARISSDSSTEPLNSLASISTANGELIPDPPSRASTTLDRLDPTSPLHYEHIIASRPSQFTRSTAHAAEFLLKGPIDLLSSLSGGFHNAPKLYGDSTVRSATPISGFQSGMKAAGKDFVLGVADGVSGVLTQPYHGARDHGVTGALSGVVKGVGGLVLKPIGAVTGVPANLLKGVYKELEKSNDFCLQTHIMLSRIAQGLAEAAVVDRVSDEEIVKIWSHVMKEADSKAREFECAITGRKHVHHGHRFHRTRNMTWAESQLHAQESGLQSTESAPLPLDRGSSESVRQRLRNGYDTASIVSSDSDESVTPKMEIMIGNGIVVRKHMTIRDMVARLKGEFHH